MLHLLAPNLRYLLMLCDADALYYKQDMLQVFQI